LVEECQEELISERDEDDALVTLFLREHLYQDHLLARAPDGTIGSLGALSALDLRELHQKRFHSSHHLWFFGGDFERQTALALVKRVAATLPGSPFSLPIVELTPNSVPKVVVVDKPDRTQVQTRIATPIVNGLHDDADPIWLGAVAFGGIFTSPFTREVRDIRGWSYFASASFQRRQRNTAPMILSAATSIDDVVDCLELQFELYEQLVRDGIGKEDLEHTRSYLLKRYPFNFTTAESLLVPSLRNELLGKSENELFEFPSKLSRFEVELVCSALQSNFPSKPSVAVLVGPADNLMPRLEKRFPHFELEAVPFKQGLGAE
jgi:zinc protease